MQIIKNQTLLLLPSDISLIKPLEYIVSANELEKSLKKQESKLGSETLLDKDIQLNIEFEDNSFGSNA